MEEILDIRGINISREFYSSDCFNVLFKDCYFENVKYIGATDYGNVTFENCKYNNAISYII